MVNNELTFDEARAELASGLKQTLAKHEEQLAKLRSRELTKSAGKKLTKADLCPLCGNLDSPKTCTCIRKNAGLGYGSQPGLSSTGVNPGGTAMAQAEKHSFKKCGSCGGAYGKHMDKCDMSEVKSGQDVAKGEKKPSQVKLDADGTVAGVSCRMNHGKSDSDRRLRPTDSPNWFECPTCEGHVSAKDIARHQGGDVKKDEDDYGENSAECPSCGHMNEPMGALGSRKHFRCRDCGQMYSHAEEKKDVKKSASYTPPSAIKAQLAPVAKNDKVKTLFGKDPKKSVMPKKPYPKDAGARPGAGGACSECGEVGHSPSQHAKKAELPIVKPAPQKSVAGAKLPGSPKKSPKTGSGGEIKKALPGMAKPAGPPKAVVGVPGKQPVGQGGGDAHKVPGAAPATSVAQANKELGAATSIARNPLAMPGMGTKMANAPKPAAPVVGNNLKPVSGSFVARKDEVSPHAEKPAAPGHAQKPHVPATAPASSPRDRSPVLGRRAARAGVVGLAALARKDETGFAGPAPTEGLNSTNHNRRLLS
jgi:hypothetical protein